MAELGFFAGDEHRPFHWEGDPERRALLVHGFPGTPAEMRPLGHVLHGAGWSITGILLPGFGPGIATLGRCRHSDWRRAVHDELAAQTARPGAVLLCGFSLGGALSIQEAAECAPSGLVLLAPFWHLAGGVRGRLLPLLRFVFRRFRPFEKADFDDPQVREMISRLGPGLNLNDPEVRDSLRRLAIPTRVINELRLAGRAAFRQAPEVRCPTLVIQGRTDPVVRPDDTRRLVERFPGAQDLIEVDGVHDLPYDDRPAWPDVQAAVLRFAASL